MPRQDHEEEEDATQQPSFHTPTKAISNDGASHGGLDAEGTKAESDPYVEKEFKESTGMLA